MAVFNVCPRPSVRLSVLRGNLKHEHIPMIHPSGSNTLFCCSGWSQVVQVIGAAARYALHAWKLHCFSVLW